ncbi:hypothetical protein LAD59_20145 [Klebsiella pneumoniae]|nr:hypothetical protein [Klebsiella pneumoniae]
MMYKRTDLTLSMFYASSADADGNKVATLTMEVIAAEVGSRPDQPAAMYNRYLRQPEDHVNGGSWASKQAVEAGKCIDRILRETVKKLVALARHHGEVL